MAPWKILVFLLFAASAALGAGAPAHDLVDESMVVDMFAEVLQRQPGVDTESAAFIVRDEDGDYRCVLWPNTAEYHRAHYAFKPPLGMVAIVHTHPLDLPEVSPGDRATAMRLRIPIYAITARSISEADVFGHARMVTKNTRWFLDRRPADLCSSSQLFPRRHHLTTSVESAVDRPGGVADSTP